ncbi:hypothetical protein GEMRC1_002699 [Eukaryota sp. GEM-RC1]
MSSVLLFGCSACHQQANALLSVDSDSSSIVCQDSGSQIPFDFVIPPTSLSSSFLYDTVLKSRFLAPVLTSFQHALLIFTGLPSSLDSLLLPPSSPSSIYFPLLQHLFSFRSHHSDQLHISLTALHLTESSLYDLLSSRSTTIKIQTDSNNKTVVPSASSVTLTSPQSGYTILQQLHHRSHILSKKLSKSSSHDVVLFFYLYFLGSVSPTILMVGSLSSRHSQRGVSRLFSQLQGHHKVTPCWRETLFNHLSRMVLSEPDPKVLHLTVLDGRAHMIKADSGLIRITQNCRSPDLIASMIGSSTQRSQSSSFLSRTDESPTRFRHSYTAPLSKSKLDPDNDLSYRGVDPRSGEVNELHLALSEEVARSEGLVQENLMLKRRIKELEEENERLRNG